MKRVLIVTPYFPPVNAPDMQRVRMSLEYFRQYGWEPTILTVNEQYAGGFRDDLLLETIPKDIEVIKVGAYPEYITRKFGLGSISLRSLFHFKKAGNKILGEKKFDLVFFSTSMHHVFALGRYWKKRFKIPFVVDIQDPWRNDFHVGKEKYNSSLKFRTAYRINKYMEAYTMPYADGIIAVSQAYIDTLKQRYPAIKNIPAKTISFGASLSDFELVKRKQLLPAIIDTNSGKMNVLYVGAVTPFFVPIIRLFFEALIENKEDLDKYHFYFIGTSYVYNSDNKMVEHLSRELGISEHVTEYPDRLPYFNALATLQSADVLFIPGSVDKDYNASKVYNNILSRTPVFSIFHEQSSVIAAIEEAGAGVVYSFNDLKDVTKIKKEIYDLWTSFISKLDMYPSKTDLSLDFTADKKTEKICRFFEEVIKHSK